MARKRRAQHHRQRQIRGGSFLDSIGDFAGDIWSGIKSVGHAIADNPVTHLIEHNPVTDLAREGVETFVPCVKEFEDATGLKPFDYTGTYQKQHTLQTW